MASENERKFDELLRDIEFKAAAAHDMKAHEDLKRSCSRLIGHIVDQSIVDLVLSLIREAWICGAKEGSLLTIEKAMEKK